MMWRNATIGAIANEGDLHLLIGSEKRQTHTCHSRPWSMLSPHAHRQPYLLQQYNEKFIAPKLTIELLVMGRSSSSMDRLHEQKSRFWRTIGNKFKK